jgi:four helix bundle protein
VYNVPDMAEVELKYKYGFRNLVAWQEAHRFTLDIYKVTRSFPTEEKFGIISQLRRSASSVGANIAEGSSRRTKRDQSHFYTLAKSSLSEVDNFLELSHDLKYLPDQDYKRLTNHLNRVAYLIHRLIGGNNAPNL